LSCPNNRFFAAPLRPATDRVSAKAGRLAGNVGASISLSTLPTRLFESLAVLVLGHLFATPFPCVCHRFTSFHFWVWITGQRLAANPVLLLPLSLPFPPPGLAKGESPLFAFGHKVSLFLGVAQDTIPSDFFAETLQQAFW